MLETNNNNKKKQVLGSFNRKEKNHVYENLGIG